MGSWGRVHVAIPFAENLTLGAMLENGVELIAICPRCKTVFKLDVGEKVKKWGSEFSLWDKRMRCRQPDCRGRCIFLCRSRGKAEFGVMSTWQ